MLRIIIRGTTEQERTMPGARSGNSSHDTRDVNYDSGSLVATAGARTACVQMVAPSGGTVLDYDRRHLALYAALLDADDAGADWQDAATSIMQLDVTDRNAEACWHSHLERARWIVGDGLGIALETFNAARSPIIAE